jgi:hypothetical protein
MVAEQEIIGCDVATLLDPETGQEEENILEHLIKNRWQSLIPSHFEQNTLEGLLKRCDWRSFFSGRAIKYPGMTWNNDRKCAEDVRFSPSLAASSLKHVVDAARSLFSRFGGRHIGVQLSGGVDSSLVIGLLRACGIPFSLVGLSTERYEFRTERYVQLILAEKSERAELIDYEQCLPLSGLESVKPHAWPDISSLNFASDTAMAEACKRLGIEVLFTGSGGDVILGTEVPENPDDCDWHPQIFNYPWPKEVVYAQHGVELVSFYDDPKLINSIYNLRRGHRDDADKLWARSFFCDFLPAELVNFTYRADFWGIYVDGLQGALGKIRELHHEAHQLTNHSYFAPENLEYLLAQDLFQTNKSLYQKIESRTALSVWIHSVKNFL